MAPTKVLVRSMSVASPRPVDRRGPQGQLSKSKGFSMGPQYGPLRSLKGSELWTSIFKVVYNGMIL